MALLPVIQRATPFIAMLPLILDRDTPVVDALFGTPIERCPIK